MIDDRMSSHNFQHILLNLDEILASKKCMYENLNIINKERNNLHIYSSQLNKIQKGNY